MPSLWAAESLPNLDEPEDLLVDMEIFTKNFHRALLCFTKSVLGESL